MALVMDGGSTVSRLQSHFEETVYFLPLSSVEFLLYQGVKYRLPIFFLFVNMAVLSFAFVHIIQEYSYAKLPGERGNTNVIKGE